MPGAGRGGPGRSRRRAGGDDADANRWLGTYGDAVTLLLAFFVMLFSMSHFDVIKFQAFVEGLADPFNNPATSSTMFTAGSGIIGDQAVDGAQFPESVSLLEDMPQVEQPRTGEGDDAPDDGDVERLVELRDRLRAALDDAGLADVGEFRIDDRGLVISIATDDVLFALGSARVSQTGRRIIAALAPVLHGIASDIHVEGHTDDLPIARADYSNWNLSTDRAVAVLTLLYEQHDIAQPRLVASGFGEFSPRAPNDGPENRALNRRVEIIVALHGESVPQ